ncbi:MAG: hypothetical protein IPO40_23430 [Fibrobacteres bacterium]|nr:hypothetical protein [Fibrobacterota bacterium]
MRKLIQNFMLITIGRDWTKSSLPKEVLDIFSKSKRKEESNQLHSLDFIDLAAILVKPYSTVTAEDLHKRIREANSKNDIDSLKELIPQSNWKRYFSKIISTCEDAQLEKKWKELYDLRCKVAHNSIVSKLDYDSIVAIAGDLKIILCDALDKLPKVSVPENERETVAEAAAVNINSLYGEFVSSWKLLLKVIHAPAQSQKFTSILSCSKYLVENGYINEDSRKIIEGLSRIRNDIVQRPIANYGESFMTELVDVLKNVIEVIKAQIEAKSKLDDPEAFDSID